MSIVLKDLSYRYGRQMALQGISLTTAPGLTAVLGPNGAGKTTLFRCILGLAHGYTGSILLNGREVRSLSPRQLAAFAAYVPQSYHCVFSYPAREVVLMGAAHRLAPYASPGRQEQKDALDLLERLGIGHLADRSFTGLSGGEQQLILIARALMQKTNILIMDEPAANLDYGNQLRLMELVRRLAREGYTVLLSTHTPQTALTYAGKILALRQGTVCAYGAADEVLTPELVWQLYGVRTTLRSGLLLPEEGFA